MNPDSFILERDAMMRPYTADVAAYCAPFSCEDSDLDEFSMKKNGFKPLYKTEQEERAFLELNPEEPLETRFMFFDLKLK